MECPPNGVTVTHLQGVAHVRAVTCPACRFPGSLLFQDPTAGDAARFLQRIVSRAGADRVEFAGAEDCGIGVRLSLESVVDAAARAKWKPPDVHIVSV